MSDKGGLPYTGPTRLSNSVWKHVLMGPEVDDVFESLCNRHRRFILLLLKEDTIETTADVMFWAEEDAAIVELDLVHSHLPKLADSGYVEWDQTTGEISKGPRFDEIESLLDLVENHAKELPDGWP